MGACQNSDGHKDQHEVLLDAQRLKSFGPLLSVTSYTWKKDSYNLFDYEAKEISKQRFKTSFSGHFLRNSHMITYSGDIDPREQLLFTFRFSKDEIRLEPNNYQFDSETSCWIIARHQGNRTKGAQYHLLEGDYLKLGRVYFRLKEINITGPRSERSPMMAQDLGNVEFTPCRICLSEAFESDDPLISPCSCTGSLKYIHYRCLKEWLNSKITIKVGEGHTHVTWEKFECELCKVPLSYQTEINGKIENLIDFEVPEKSLILETFGKKNALKGFYILNLAEKTTFKMGRAIDNEIRINDISVSRTHASISVANNEVFFNDFDSKFGSLILLRRPINLKLCTGLVPIQIGRSVFKIFPSWDSQAADALCCKSINDARPIGVRNHEKIDEFEISEEGLEELSFEEMLMFSGNNQMVYSN